jgi:hypothetical protein
MDTLAPSSTVPIFLDRRKRMPFASVNGQQLYFEDTAGTGPVTALTAAGAMLRPRAATAVQ